MKDTTNVANAIFLPAEQTGIIDYQGKWFQVSIIGGGVIQYQIEKPDLIGFLAMEQSPDHLLYRRPELVFSSGQFDEMISFLKSLVAVYQAGVLFKAIFAPYAIQSLQDMALTKIDAMAKADGNVLPLLEVLLSAKPLRWPYQQLSDSFAGLINASASYPDILSMVHRLHDLQLSLQKVWKAWTIWEGTVEDKVHRNNLRMFFQHSDTFQCLAKVLGETGRLTSFNPQRWVESIPDHQLLKIHEQGTMVHLRVGKCDRADNRPADFVNTQRQRLPFILEALIEPIR